MGRLVGGITDGQVVDAVRVQVVPEEGDLVLQGLHKGSVDLCGLLPDGQRQQHEGAGDDDAARKPAAGRQVPVQDDVDAVEQQERGDEDERRAELARRVSERAADVAVELDPGLAEAYAASAEAAFTSLELLADD